VRLVDPRNEASAQTRTPAPRLHALAGAKIALLDISKPGGDIFLNRLEALLKQQGAAEVTRHRKPTFAKPAPEEVMAKIKATRPDAVIEALAD
jgi:hypothetical protein